MHDFIDRTRTGISILTSAAVANHIPPFSLQMGDLLRVGVHNEGVHEERD